MSETGTKIDIIKLYVSENWQSFLVVSMLSALASLIEIFGIFAFIPLLAKEADIPLPGFIAPYLVQLSIVQILYLIGFLFFLKAIILTGVSYVRAKILTQYETQFIYDFFDSIVQSQWRYFISKPVGEIINTALKECPAAAMIYTHIITLFSSALQLVVLGFFSLYISWEATVLGGVGGLVILKAFDFLPKKLKLLGGEFQITFKETSGLLNDFFSNIKPLKSMQKDKSLFSTIRPRLTEQALLRRNLSFIKSAASLVMEPIIVIFVCVILYISLEVLSISFTETVALIMIFYKLMTGWKVFNQSLMSMAEYENFYWAVKNEIQCTTEQRENNYGSLKHDFQDNIVLQNIGFSYDDCKSVFSGLSFSIPCKQLTAIVGPSGSGKTTIIDILCKLHIPTSGRVTVDNIDLQDIDTGYWRTQIGYVPQEFFMLHDTLRHNITLGDRSYDDGTIRIALQKAGALSFVDALEYGLDTIVGEKGVRFSGGQRQRISIARALLRKPKLLILDEATTALDPDTERSICKELKKLVQDTTIVAISHQSAILHVADNVIELDSLK